MYEKDGIVYASTQDQEIRIKDIKVLPGGMMLVQFQSGEMRLFDTNILTGSAFDKLKNKEVMNNANVIRGFITWDNGEIDVAPDFVY